MQNCIPSTAQTIHEALPKPIGLSVARPKPCDRELKIIQIHKGGSIDEWNQKEKARTANETEHLNDGPKDVREGDFISTVNVVSGNGKRLLDEISSQDRCRIYVKRRKTVLLPIKKEHE